MDIDAPDWVDHLILAYQDRLTRGLYEAIYRLDDRSVETVMQGQAQTCVDAFLDLTDLPIPMDVDDFLERMRTSGASKVELSRDGNVILWSEQHEGKCVCPFVRRGVIRLDPKLCICGANWVKYLFETVTKTPVAVETLGTAATGEANCEFRITLSPPDS